MRQTLSLRWAHQAAILVVLLLINCGCGSASDGETVTGRITFKGQPLTNATVTFFPQQGRPAIASLAGDGAYSVRLPPGSYQVTVMVGANLPPGYKEGDPLPPPAVRLPAHYTVRARTQLSAEVAENRSEPINFDLQ